MHYGRTRYSEVFEIGGSTKNRQANAYWRASNYLSGWSEISAELLLYFPYLTTRRHWEWASNDKGRDPGCCACFGDVPTLETLAAFHLGTTRPYGP
ncbi:hypothetical protein GFB56_30535 [Ensifer sp. T173]|uniref:Xylulose 5-phosphate/Fructose 6-phosphate phosphoketolase C-terminal domain-containing protein n=1 Tax=Ensifer canadensis TaxID=555315 RepID=A0AAW4FV11_9HYPH|nr:hypothetical protein [Ensifer canadensis]